MPTVNKTELPKDNGISSDTDLGPPILDKMEPQPLPSIPIREVKLGNISSFPCPYQPGDWVVVRYDDLLYPGEVISLPSNGIEINAMEPTTCGSYKWPTRKDVHTYLLEDVVKKIEPPIPCGSRASQFTFKDSF